MARRIKRVADLPEWFDLANYHDAKSLNTAGWFEQLSVRKDLLYLIGATNAERPRTKPIAKYLAEVAERVRLNPIVDTNLDDILRAYFYGGAMHEVKAREPLYSYGVRLSTVRDLYTQEHLIEPGKRKYSRGFFAEIFEKDWTEPLLHKRPDWIDEPVDNIANTGFTVTAQINMLLPDAVLIDQFRKLIDRVRAPMRSHGLDIAVPNYRKPDFAAWIEFGVLPYLDLKIWECEAEVTIPNRVMADAIFRPGEGGEEVVRKTTAKYAEELLSDRQLETLAALSAYENMEANDVPKVPENCGPGVSPRK